MSALNVMQETLRFAGYAGIFDTPDADRDTIRSGAFQATLARQTSPLPLLWQHRPDQVIGEVQTIEEDNVGLRVIASINRTDSKAARMLKTRKVNGLSFGYRARDVRMTQSGRELLAIDLFEISLVSHPLQHHARVHLVS